MNLITTFQDKEVLKTWEKESGICDYFVKLDVRVERNVEIEDGLAQARYNVPTHRQQQEWERERHSCGCAACQADSVSSDATPTSVLLFDSVSWQTVETK